MKITTREKEDVVILDLEGSIDINSADFVETVGWALITKSKNILCNFEGINLIDYVGISLIAVAYKNILNHKGRMKLCNVPSHVQKLFSIVGLDKVFTYYENEDEAIKSFTEEVLFSHILEQRLRRRFKRIPLHNTIEYKQKYSPKDIFHKGKIINLSAIGVFLAAEKVFSIGEILTTRIDLTPAPGVIEVDSKVVWEADSEIQPMESPGMGLEFYDISPEVQEQIINFVEKHLTHSSQE
ncbi:MAG: anti-sigma factor antagonist [Candidatus Omnitrophica bacterium]|jgi:stage II sporulation protein AA (anti-sigma F factor antagonist)|nr:anti-sigma factor antagonist [Candidatus Omnitrophota bacterium]